MNTTMTDKAWGQGQGKLVDMKQQEFTAEDVEHIDQAICQIRNDEGSLALPGLEWVRNKVAARAGVELKLEGTIQYSH